MVLLLDQLTKPAFASSAQVVELTRHTAVLLLPAARDEDLDTVGEVETEGLVEEDEVFGGVRASDRLDLVAVLCLQGLEDVQEHAIDDIHDFLVVRFEGHLEIEANELRQVTMCVRVFGTEDWAQDEWGTRRWSRKILTRADLKNTLHVRSNAHLLGKLRALGEEDRLAEVVDFEDSSA